MFHYLITTYFIFILKIFINMSSNNSTGLLLIWNLFRKNSISTFFVNDIPSNTRTCLLYLYIKTLCFVASSILLQTLSFKIKLISFNQLWNFRAFQQSFSSSAVIFITTNKHLKIQNWTIQRRLLGPYRWNYNLFSVNN